MAITQPGDTTVISFVSVPGDAGPATRAESVQGGFVALPSGSGPPTTTNLPLPLRRAGTLAYTPSDNKFWQLIGGTADVNWVEKASVGNGGLITVVDNSARDAIPATVRAEGMIVYSKKTKLYYSLDADLTTWRAIGSNPSLVAQAAWYVSQATGNDSNSGTILDPIASLDGIRERLNPGGATLRPAQNTTVYVLDGTFPELALAIAIPVGSNYTFDVRCTVASSASFTLATVVDSALTASPIRGRITTASALLTDKAFIRTTNGANPGAIAIVDGLNSSTDAYVKPWLYEVSANNIFNVNIAPGTSCVVDTLQVTINRVRIVNSGGTPVGGAVRIFGAIIPHGIEWVNVVGGSGGFYAYECIIGTTNLAENAKVSGNCGVRSCRIIGAGTGVTANFSVQGLLDVIFLGCSIEAQISIGAAETQFIRGCTFNGGSLAVGFPGNGAPFHAGVGLSEPNQWVNGAGLTAVTVQTNAYLSISDQQAGFGAAYATGIALVSGAKATASSIALLGINATQQVTMVGRKHTYAQLPKDYPNSDCTFSLASDLSGLPSGFPDLTVSDWYVSPSGSDTTGDGLSLGTAFATTERLGAVLCPGGTTLTVRQNTIVHLAAGTYNAIELSLSFPIGSNYTFDVKGDFTSSSPITLSSVTNTVEGVPGTAVRGAIATASGTFVDKGRIRSTSGASVGAITYCTGLNGDAQHAFVKEWFLESSFSAVNIANGTTCVVDTLGVTINRVQIRTSGHKIDGTFRINDVILPNGAEFINTVSGSNNVGLSQCQIGNSTGVSCRFSGNLQTRNCRFTGSSAITFLGMAIPVIWGCAIESVLICSLASMQVYANNCFNGGSLIAGGNGTSQGNYGIAIGATEWVNGAGLTAISCQPGSSVRVIGQQFSFGTAYAVGWALDSGALCVTDTVAHLGPAATQPITMTGHNVNYTDVPRTYPNAACYFVLLSDPSSLPFAAPPVTSVFGRLGAIAAALNDYTSSLVQNLSSVTSGGTTVTTALNALQAQITASVSGVASVFGRSGAVVAAAGDYTDAQINNTSSVSGAKVKDALDTLKASVAALVSGVSSVYGRAGAVVAAAGDYNSTQVNNSSGVAGSTVTAALNTLNSAISALVTGVSSFKTRTGAVVPASGDYTDAQVDNTSTVTGAHVSDALTNLKASIAALVTGVSSVHGRTGAVVAAAGDYTSSLVNNASSVAGSTVSAALNTLLGLIGVTYSSVRSATSTTLVLSDARGLIRVTGLGIITIPTNASVAFAQFAEIDLLTTTTGSILFSPAGGVTLRTPSSYDSTIQWAKYRLVYLGSDEWLLTQELNAGRFIVDAMVSSAAAIAGSKINPAFGSQNISNTGNINNTGNITSSGIVQAAQFGDGTTGLVFESNALSTPHDYVFNIGGVPIVRFGNGNFISYSNDNRIGLNNDSATTLNSGNSTASGTLASLTIKAKDGIGSGTYKGGTLALAGGSGTTGSGSGGDIVVAPGNGLVASGNTAIGDIPASFQSMQKGIFILNAAAVPTGNPSGGGFLYVDAGALKYRGSSGTVTTLGPA